MSQKKHKKRHPQQAKRPAAAPSMESEFASDSSRKRMDRTARNLLLLSLVLIAASQLFTQLQIVSNDVANVLALLALLVLLSSLWFQFGNPSGGSQSRGGGRLQ